jgi:16S rRNA processing protein RimM
MPERTHTKSSKQGLSAKGQVYRVRNQDVVVPDGCLAVAQIIGVHGLRGEIKLDLYTDFPERFAPGERLMMGVDLTEVELVSVRPHQKFLLIRLQGVDDRTAAEALRGQWLFVDEEEAAELEEGAYWIHDLIGLQVVETSGAPLGVIVDVLITGANDVYVIHPPAGQNAGRDILLPAIPDVIRAVDVPGGVMTVHLIEGLIDPEVVD